MGRTFGLPWADLNDGIVYEDIVSLNPNPNSNGKQCTLLEYYSFKYNDSAPKEGWLKRIQNRQVKINDVVVKLPNAIVRTGDHLSYHRLPWQEPAAPWKLVILFEDDHLLAIDKPPGLQVLPGGLYQQRTVLTQLKWRSMNLHGNSYEGENSRDAKVLQPCPVHRLGRGTSGVLLCAKSKIAKAKLSSDFAAGAFSEFCSAASRPICKTYRALAAGIVAQDEIYINQPIGTLHYPGVSKGLYVALSTGKPSKSKMVVLLRNLEHNSTLVEVEIFSGRPHQIRIHLAYIGHPLIGDPLYVAGGQPDPKFLKANGGGRTNEEDGGYCKPANAVPGDCGYLLHAYKLVILHPILKESLEIIAPPPYLLSLPGEEARSLDAQGYQMQH